MKIKFLLLTSLFNKSNSWTFFQVQKNTSYIIESIEGPRSDELKNALENLNQSIPSDIKISLEYNVTEYLLSPTVHVKYTINGLYTYYFSFSFKNKQLPWNINKLFIKNLAYSLNRDIQKSIVFIKNKKNTVDDQSNINNNQ